MSTLRALVPKLPRDAWAILGGDLLSAIGTGLTLPFLVVYLYRVRGIDLGLAGLALSMLAVAGLVATPLAGWLTDRFGSRKTVMGGLLLTASASVWIAFVDEPWEALAAAAAFGAGGFTVLPAQDSLLATVVTPAQRSSVFSVRHATFNAGMGVGMVTSALIVDLSSARSFQLIYFLDAATFLAFAAVLLRLRHLGVRVPDEEEEQAGPRGYRRVFADRLFLRVWVLMAVLVTVGYAQYQAAFPAYATGRGLSAGALGIVFAANMVAVVALQLVVLKLMEGRRRTRGIVLVCVSIAAAWALTLAAGTLGGGAAAVGVLALAMIVLAVGETLVSPTIPPLVNDLAPDRLRGHYNGAFSLVWTGGFMIGPALAGFVLAAGHGDALFLGFIAACAVTALGALELEAKLPRRANLVGGAEAGETAGAEVATAEAEWAAPAMAENMRIATPKEELDAGRR